MVCHLGWYFAVGCPLRGDRGEYKQKKFRKKGKKNVLTFLGNI
jgi:hypothetical protein